MNWDTVTVSINGSTFTIWQACAILIGVCLAGLAVIILIFGVVLAVSRRDREAN